MEGGGRAQVRWPRGRCRLIVEAGQVRVAGRIIEHGYASLLHDTVWGQLNGLKCAEVHQGHLLGRVTVTHALMLTVTLTVTEPLGACGKQGTVEKELMACIPHQTVPLQVKIGLDMERLHRAQVPPRNPAHDMISNIKSFTIS